MGVYTNLPQDQIEDLINQYDRGKPIQISPIAGGIENSNFFVVLSQFELEQSYVLTLIEVADENRANQITQLMTHLSFYGFPVPEVITARTGHRLIKEGTHPVMLSEKVAGHHVMKPRAEHCQQLGSTLAQFHQIASAFSSPPPQPYDPLWLTSIIAAQSPHISSATLTRLYEAATQYEMIQGSGLPNGWTHGDAFRDNVLFTDTGELSALLDYFHAGEDCLMMDLAIALNDWCYASTSEAVSYTHLTLPTILRV